MISDSTIFRKSSIYQSLSINIKKMNQSFQVIIDHHQFVEFKEIEKENKKNIEIIHELKRQHENIKLKFQQLEIRCRSQELNIKDLSKNSIRLSRRLLIQQEQHHKTQQNYLQREKQLLQKLLNITSQHQNSLSSIKKTQQANNKIAEQTLYLKKKIDEKDKIIINLTASLAQMKKEIKDLQEKYAKSQRLVTQQTKIANHLTIQLESLLAQKEKIIRDSYLNKNEHDSQMSKVLLQMKSIKAKLQEANFYLKQEKSINCEQKRQLLEKMHEKDQSLSKLSLQIDSLFTKNLVLSQKIKIIVEQLKKVYEEEKQKIEIHLLEYSSYLREMSKSFSISISKQVGKILSKSENHQQLHEGLWKILQKRLSLIRNNLRSEGFPEADQIIQLQFDDIFANLKKKFFKPWMIK